MKKLLSLLMALVLVAACTPKDTDLTTTFEKSNFLETDDYDGTIAYARQLAKQFKEVHYQTIATTAQGREVPLLIVDENGYTKPKKIRKSGKSIILVEACIHPGEPNGKDAMFMLIRNMLRGRENGDLLKDFSFLFIPVLSPDGLANFSPFKRINQNGPKEMGWRVNAQGLNLNRDFTKLDSPELRGFVELFNRWQPDLFFDTHATNGADYQYVTTYSIEDFGNYDAGISYWLSRVWEPKIKMAMSALDMPVTRYIEFHPWGDPTAPLYDESFSAMFSEAYTTARNCPGILLETHMLKPYKDRVLSSYHMIVETLKIIRDDKANFQNVIVEAKKNDLNLKELPINMQSELNDTLWVDFLGYHFDTVHSDITGGWYYAYDTTRPETRRTRRIRATRPEKTLAVPKEYIIPAQYKEVIDIVKAHGFDINFLKSEKTLKVGTYRFENVAFAPQPSEGRCRVAHFDAQEITKDITFPKGSAVVKTSQNGIRLLMNLLEPEMHGSLFEWGFFNHVLQRVEYFEVYKMEPMAKEMLAADPFLAEQFQQWMASFPKDKQPSQYEVLGWFYERSPYCDKDYLVYPIGIVR
ncbi:MAG: M14 family metallopeptidase [Bacteroidales bacterium]|nr:M14 family metallopeptidase [Bacteroidales bacterium]